MKSPRKPSVAIHGHFYQPPREDPWFETVPVQPGAAPFHDWNERVHGECYQPITAARILDANGDVRRVLNCLEYMSFNFGPTLLSWLEKEAPETYAAILDADKKSMERTGFGGAMAMPFHHPILPLSSDRDRLTEVRWGIQDFRRRFGRDPVGMWCPETAVDPASLDVLAAEGIEFTIVAPHQVDPIPTGGRPGVYETPSGSITLLPYDGTHAHAVAFGDVLRDADAWTASLMEDLDGAGRGALRLLATDGETFGHHKKFGEMALAAALERLAESDDVGLVNLEEYLAAHPADEEVDLVAPTSWSCAHGVGRWKEDCGCKLDVAKKSQQKWRGPLRDAVTVLADGIHDLYQAEGVELFTDPWEVRDAYGAVVGTWDPSLLRSWVEQWQKDAPDDASTDRAVRLLELERNALRLFTSCAWFFDDVAGVEPVQILRYAARAIELMKAVGSHVIVEDRFLELLEGAVSNDPKSGNGRRVYLERAQPTIPPPALAAAGAAVVNRFGDARFPLVYRAYAVDLTASDENGNPLQARVRHRATGEVEVYTVSVQGDDATAAKATIVDEAGRTIKVDRGKLPEAARLALVAQGPALAPHPAGSA